MSAVKTAKIFGLMFRVRDDGARVVVPFGVYNVEEFKEDHYRFSGEGLPTFELEGSELTSYLGARIQIIEGESKR